MFVMICQVIVQGRLPVAITPSGISAALRGEFENMDHETLIDLDGKIRELSMQDQKFLSLYAAGYSPKEAAKLAELAIDGQARFNKIVRLLSQLLS